MVSYPWVLGQRPAGHRAALPAERLSRSGERWGSLTGSTRPRQSRTRDEARGACGEGGMAQVRQAQFERFMVLVGLVSPVATVPQVIKIFATHSAHAVGQSLTTWAVYTAISILWV